VDFNGVFLWGIVFWVFFGFFCVCWLDLRLFGVGCFFGLVFFFSGCWGVVVDFFGLVFFVGWEFAVVFWCSLGFCGAV